MAKNIIREVICNKLIKMISFGNVKKNLLKKIKKSALFFFLSVFLSVFLYYLGIYVYPDNSIALLLIKLPLAFVIIFSTVSFTCLCASTYNCFSIFKKEMEKIKDGNFQMKVGFSEDGNSFIQSNDLNLFYKEYDEILKAQLSLEEINDILKKFKKEGYMEEDIKRILKEKLEKQSDPYIALFDLYILADNLEKENNIEKRKRKSVERIVDGLFNPSNVNDLNFKPIKEKEAEIV